MTKKHFEAIARALSAALAQSLAANGHHLHAAIMSHHDALVARLCIEFNAFNAGFDAARFETASKQS